MLGNKGTKKNYRTGGTRGGLSQFKWEDVKLDKDRENYLGHSLSAPVGRWQKGKDLTWYSKSSSSQQEEESKRQIEEEKRRIREADDDLINQAIGIQPNKRKFVENQIDEVELKHILSKGGLERESMDIERVKGIGSGPIKFHDHLERNVITSVTKEILKLQKQLEPNSSSSSSSSMTSNTHIIPLKEQPIDGNHHDVSTITERNHTKSDDKDERHHHHHHKPKKEKKEKKEKKKHKKDKKDHSHHR